MNPTQAQPGYYWNTNDGAALDFEQAGPEKPTTVRCYMMDDLAGYGGTVDIQVCNLHYLAAGIFGEPRGKQTRWTGESHRYGIYEVRSELSTWSTGIVILERHGGGMVGYAFESHSTVNTWRELSMRSTPEQLWDVCNMLAKACTTSRNTTATDYRRAIIDKRIKIKRRNGSVSVSILPKVEAAA